MSFKPEVQVNGEWSNNTLCFATNLEALGYARDLYSRWTLTTNYRAIEGSEPVTHKWKEDTRELTDIDTGYKHAPPIRVSIE